MEIADSSNNIFANAQNKMIEFMQSDKFTLKDPNKLNQDKLLLINKLGFLTIQIQYGREIIRDHHDINSTHIEDRAYIAGFIKKSMVKQFMKKIKENKNIIACEKIITWIKHSSMIPLSLDDKKIIKNVRPTITPGDYNKLKKSILLDDINDRDISLIYCIDVKFNRLANSQFGIFNHIIKALEAVNKN